MANWLFTVLGLWLAMQNSFLYFYLIQKNNFQLNRILDYLRIPEELSKVINPIFRINLLLWLLSVFSFFATKTIKVEINLLISLFLLIELFFNSYQNLFRSKDLALAFTPKIKLLFSFYNLSLVIIFGLIGYIGFAYKILIILSCLVFAPLQIGLILLLIHPLELRAKKKLIQKAQQHRQKYKDLRIPIITGSYGKSSTQNFIANLLETNFNPVLKRQLNLNYKHSKLNTLYEINTRLLETDSKTDYFLVEVGTAIKTKDLDILAKLLNPQTVILTGLDLQSYTYFGSEKKLLEHILTPLIELAPGSNLILNWSSKKIQEIDPELYAKHKVFRVGMEGYCQISDLEIQIINVQKFGIDNQNNQPLCKFDLKIKDKVYPVSTNILDDGNIQNLALALSYVYTEGFDIEFYIQKVIGIHQNLQIINLPQIRILTNFKTNYIGFENAIDMAQYLPGQKVLLIGDIPALGSKSISNHKKLAQDILKYDWDKIIFLGKGYRQVLIKSMFIAKVNPKKLLAMDEEEIVKRFSEIELKTTNPSQNPNNKVNYILIGPESKTFFKFLSPKSKKKLNV